MDISKQYTIPWRGLKNGKHHFDYKIDKRFFDSFAQSDIKSGNADVSVEMEKSATMLLLDFHITGTVIVECDRCLGDLELPVDYSGGLKVKFSDEIDEYDGEIMWISQSESQLSVWQYIYESILLSLPYQRVHGDGNGCDPEMLARFRIISQEEFDEMTADTETLEETPAGEKLRHLKEKLENLENE